MDENKIYTKLQECPICLGEMTKEVASVPCGHIYHKTCIEQSLAMHKKCPVCRADTVKDQVRKIHFNIEDITENIEATQLYQNQKLKAEEYERNI